MKNVLLGITDSNFSYLNPISVVSNCLKSLKNLLEECFFNVQLFPDNKNKNYSSKHSGYGYKIKNVFKNNLPFVYRSIADYKYFSNQKRLINNLINLTNTENTDIIIEWLYYGSDFSFQMKKKKRIPYIIIFDTPLEQQYLDIYGTKSVYYNFISKKERISVINADKIICYSNAMIGYLENKYNIDRKKCHILPFTTFNKIQFQNFTEKKHDNINIGFIGSFLKWHKIEIIVKVFNELASKYNNINLYLLGTGETWNFIKNITEKSFFKKRIFLPGFITGKQLSAYLQKFDIGILPGTAWYCAPAKLFEYADYSMAVIAPATPTIKELFVNGDEILLFNEENSEEEIYNHLKFLIENESERLKLSKNINLALNTRYSKELYKQKYIEIINSVLLNLTS